VSGSRDPWLDLNDWQLTRAIIAELPQGLNVVSAACYLVYGHTHQRAEL